MSQLLFSLLISLGIQFTILDSGKTQISSSDYTKLKSTLLLQNKADQPLDDIIISDGVDPVSCSQTHE
ncbi:MAG: hypothetical protein ABI763_10240 [Bacteroidota bacterium]